MRENKEVREKVASTYLWSESIFFYFIWPVTRNYLIYSGIVFNVFLILLLIWR